MVSTYQSSSPLGIKQTIYDQEEWRSDAWDPMSYGRSFDFNRGFFEQMRDLRLSVPRMSLITVNNENSAFTTGVAYSKNCYLINFIGIL